MPCFFKLKSIFCVGLSWASHQSQVNLCPLSSALFSWKLSLHVLIEFWPSVSLARLIIFLIRRLSFLSNSMDLENTTRRLRRRENGVIFPYMDVARPLSRRLRRRVVFSKSIYYSTVKPIQMALHVFGKVRPKIVRQFIRNVNVEWST